MAILFLIAVPSNAFRTNTGFWRAADPYLRATIANASLTAHNCHSAAVVVTLFGPFYNAAAPASPVTVNLASSGSMLFYSDTACSVSITSATVTAPNNSVNIFLVPLATGNQTITVTATGYVEDSVTVTASANNFIWTGNGADANWSTAQNWSGNVVPGNNNPVVFNGGCNPLNCSPILNTAMSFAGNFRMAPDFPGTITQGAIDFTVNGHFAQLGGTFNGSTGVLQAPTITITGGTFNQGTGTVRTNGSISTWRVESPGSFVANGPVHFRSTIFNTSTLIPGSGTYNDVSFEGNGGTSNITGSLSVLGTLTYGGTSLGTGTILAGGDVTFLSAALGGTGGVIRLTGRPGGQQVTAPASGTHLLPSLEIDTGSNPVTMTGLMAFSRDFIVTSVGTFNAASAPLRFYRSSGTTCPFTFTPGAGIYASLTFDSECQSSDLAIGGTANIDGDLNISARSGRINTGTIEVTGNVTLTSTNGGGLYFPIGGTGLVRLVGRPGGQTVSGVMNAGLPSLEVDTGTDPVTFSGTIGIQYDYRWLSSGTLTAGSSTLQFLTSGTNGTWTVEPGTPQYGDVRIDSPNSGHTLGTTGTFKIYNLYAGGSVMFNGGTIDIGGDITVALNGSLAPRGGTTLMRLTGNVGGQIVSGISSGFLPNLEIDTGLNPVTFTGGVSIQGNYTVTSVGVFMASTSTLRFWGPATSATITATPGTVEYGDVTWDPNLGSNRLAIIGTLRALGNLHIQGNASSIDTGTIEVGGNVTLAMNGANGAAGGSGTVRLIGNVAGQSIIGPLSGTPNLPNLEIAAGIHPVTLTNTISVTGDFRVTSVGALDASSATLRIAPNANNTTVTIDGGGKVFDGAVSFTPNSSNCAMNVVGTWRVDGDLILRPNNGTINNGTIEAGGNITMQTNTSTIRGGTGTVRLVGNAAGQTVTGIATGLGFLPNFEIAAGTNNVTLTSTVGVARNFTITSVGILDTSAGIIVMNALGLTSTVTVISVGGRTLRDVGFQGGSGNRVDLGSDLVVTDTVSYANTMSGTNMQGFNMTLGGLSLAGRTITRSGGTLTVGGVNVTSGGAYGGTVNP